MTRARILADYVAGGTTAAEFDHIDGLTSSAVGINDTQTLANKTLSSGTILPSDCFIKRYTTRLANGYSNGSTASHIIDNAGTSNNPSTTVGVLIGTSANVVLDGTQKVVGSVTQPVGEWQNNGATHMILWGTKDSGSNYTFMGGASSNDYGCYIGFTFEKVLAAGTWVFTCKIGVQSAHTYGSWWGGRGVYGATQWGADGDGKSETAGHMIIEVGGTT